MNWSKVRGELERDGSLRDLYIFDISIGEWDTFLAALRSWHYPYSFTVDGDEASLPESAVEAFATRQRACPLLHVDVEGLTVATHFFDECELELDIDPAEVLGEPQLASLSGFMRRLGDLLAKPVALTHENHPEGVIATYEPAHRAFDYPS